MENQRTRCYFPIYLTSFKDRENYLHGRFRSTLLSLTASSPVPRIFWIDHTQLYVSVISGTCIVLNFPLLHCSDVKYVFKKFVPLPAALLPLKAQKLQYYSHKSISHPPYSQPQGKYNGGEGETQEKLSPPLKEIMKNYTCSQQTFLYRVQTVNILVFVAF